MKSIATEQALKRKLDTLLALDMSTMGYEAKARHGRRVEQAQQAYDKVAAHTQSGTHSDCALAPVD